MTSDGDGHVPLFCAAHWIATEGGAKIIDPDKLEVWQPAYRKLLTAIISGQAQVFGVEAGARVPVEGYKFVDCAIQYPYHIRDFDIELGGELLLLKSFPYDDEDAWLDGLESDGPDGFSDALVGSENRGWSHLTLLKSNVLAAWPFGGSEKYKTGDQGRPTSAPLIDAELEAIGARGELEPAIGKQARALVEWLKFRHPEAPQPTWQTVATNIRVKYWRLRRRKK
jgi:hypothetical protein